MADAEAVEVLEQRERKPRRPAAEANGHADVPDFAAAEDFGGEGAVAGDSTDVPEPEDVEDSGNANTKIYFVRMPRPPINDELVKKLSAQFTEQVAKLKAMNAKLSTKREELRELYRQKDAGYSLKGDSQPEFTEKVTRRNQLRDVRNDYQRKISAIKENLRGLDCKSEEELDAKVKELEERITHGSLPLREEKQLVGQISKLQAQRAQVRDYENQKTSLVELESELQKVLAVLEELEGEVDILKGEREQAEGIIKGIKGKIDTCKAELKELEEEQEAAVAAKNDALSALEKARGEMNESMSDYRDNRSFSLKVRDLVTAGQVEEARALCAAQVDDVVGRIASDAIYRKEYYKLWAAQRKYAVSELLPDSTTVVREAKPDQGKVGGKGGRADRAPPPKPQGAEKARLLIEKLMAEAQAEASRKVAGRPPADDAESSGDADDELDAPGPVSAAPAVTLPVVEVTKPKSSASSARPADVLKAVELPVLPDDDFVPPVVKAVTEKSAADAAQDKERLRAEQQKKAQEAELRKKKLAEAKEKKRLEMEAKRKVDEEQRKAQEAEAAAERARKAAADKAEADAKRKAQEAAAKAAADAKAASSNPAAKVIAKSQVTVAAKAKPPSNDPLRVWKQLKKDTNLQLIILAVVLGLIMIGLVVMAMRG
ncbi:hypothetical protein GPECTOR_70g502 [Gonium pectorale]|uniref:Proton pump-interactor 1 n=1 Tax=Gonium pectorale TaxID=33097 RepID=A0A150G3A3_GONPE|nr:hypothetical protein GPECTOR_70g502 [Gonium pectorale]|eukprot:KXZ44271.1 hypothetical protein GPECTOR_70g502 [Gonium pectorale]